MLALPLVAAYIAALTPAATPTVVLERVQKFYAGSPQLTTTFDQEVTRPTFGSTEKSSGTAYFAKPDKMRWDYKGKKDGKVRNSFIFDGATLWVVEPSFKKVTKTKAATSSMPAALSFLAGKASLAKDFKIALAAKSPYATTGATVLELIPKKASTVKQLFFVVGSDGRVQKSIVIDANDNTNAITFTAANGKNKIDPKIFKFDPKKLPLFNVEDADAKP